MRNNSTNRVATKTHWTAEYTTNNKKWFATTNKIYATRYAAEKANITMHREIKEAGIRYRVTKVEIKAVSYNMVDSLH